MQAIDSESLSEFMNRFVSFYDAIIRQIQHRYLPRTQQTTIILSTRDQNSEQLWSNVTLVATGVSEVLFRECKSTRVILSDGLTLKWLDSRLWCDFSPYCSDAPETQDYFRRSDFYLICEELSWVAEPYCE